MHRLPGVSVKWAEGRYLDLWMLVHFLSGVAGGLTNVFFELPARWVYALGAAMMVAWEIGERALGVRESWSNRVIDVVVGLGGVWVALAAAARVSPRAEYWMLGITLGIALLLLRSGLRAYRARQAAPPLRSE